MKKYLKHSVYLAILLSSISAGAVYAKVPVPDKHYDNFVYSDEAYEVSGKDKVYHFDKGVEFSGSKYNGIGRKSPGSLHLEDASATINIGKADGMTHDGSFYGRAGALRAEKGSKLTINASNGNLYFENKPDTPLESFKTIEVRDGSDVCINAKSVYIRGGSWDGEKSGNIYRK